MSTPSLADLAIADMLPDIELPTATGETPVPLRSVHGETTVIFWPHAIDCRECDRYLDLLGTISDDLRIWDARLLILVSLAAAAKLPPPSFGTVLVNDRLRVEGAGVIVADRYGQVFYLATADQRHTLPSVQELTEWLKHLGTLCPE